MDDVSLVYVCVCAHVHIGPCVNVQKKMRDKSVGTCRSKKTDMWKARLANTCVGARECLYMCGCTVWNIWVIKQMNHDVNRTMTRYKRKLWWKSQVVQTWESRARYVWKCKNTTPTACVSEHASVCLFLFLFIFLLLCRCRCLYFCACISYMCVLVCVFAFICECMCMRMCVTVHVCVFVHARAHQFSVDFFSQLCGVLLANVFHI
jgi:hypothetical protein